MNNENSISKSQNILLILSDNESKELQYLAENFCGIVARNLLDIPQNWRGKRLYFCGDAGKLSEDFAPIFIVKELAYNYIESASKQVIHLGQVPIILHDAGVYYRDFFAGKDYFHKIQTEHDFQDLTESTKPSIAIRKAIYLTEVTKEATQAGEVLHYHVLRCSSNLSGATENFRETDREIIAAINAEVPYIFEKPARLNHVLAQVYENRARTDQQGKEKKSTIKAHSDKTKDMPQDGLIVFCTFYDNTKFDRLKPAENDPFDWHYKGQSGLTRLRFRLKHTDLYPNLVKEFDVTLYPNSVFFIPLSTNRLYTHEIKPSALTVEYMPTRMGYVARSSNKEAVFMNEQAYIKEKGELIKLVPMTYESMIELRDVYREENKSSDTVVYEKVDFSMNLGDYQKPIF